MKWFVFDYGNVLSLPQPPSDVEVMARTAGTEPAAFERGYWEHRLEFDRGALSPSAYWAAVLGRPVSASEMAKLVAMDVASWAHPNAPVIAVLDELLDRGVGVALLSNAPVCLADGLDELPWIAAIEQRFYSGRMGLVKPDREIYERVAGELGGDPADMAFIDDRPENVAGARAFGMTGVHYTSAPALRDELATL
ncbi:HAD family phosphatase [Nonomuraea sp. NN258]|uniref:HAD family hydrolase n=1 Tax=Nonomuraea antri TaxID=2730852 RepID=UPI0015693370|nr:HAD family phosphatase [Nonomuraea antri]NRQ33463.1 HAD family phosphatase [Nonomuraea antri]